MANIPADEHRGFDVSTPEALGIPSAAILDILELTRKRGLNLHSLMVLRHGKVAAQLWWKPYAPELPHQLYSFSKSVTATAVAFAIDEGLLSLGDRIAHIFKRRIEKDADERIYTLTIEHLLTMTSGACAQNEAGMVTQVDWVRWYLNTPLKYDPGERFVYNSLNTYMLAAAVNQVTGECLTEYLTPRLFEPLGIAVPQWDKCPMGVECGGWGLSLTTEDMAKLAQLYLDGGVWKGKQILPEGWAHLAGEYHVPTADYGKMNTSPHRTAGYGYQLWRGCDGVSYRMDGMFGQYGVILPEQDAVIVTTAGHAAQMDILDALWQALVPRIGELPEGSLPGEDYDELCLEASKLALPGPRQKFRCLEREREESGRVYEFTGNVMSMLPLSIRYLYKIRALGVDRIRFDFGEDISTMTWREDAGTKQVPFRLDGRFCDCSLRYGGKEYPAVTSAAWTDRDVLEIDIRLTQTAHMQRSIFTFTKDEITYTFDEDPPIEDSIKMLLDMYRSARPLSARLAKLTKRVIPTIKGTPAALTGREQKPQE